MRPQWIDEWFTPLLDYAQFRVATTTLATSQDWQHVGGSIRHRSDRFFGIVGVKWESPAGEAFTQPLIEQREIGTLGFLVRNSEGSQELLVQAKIEPGNVGIIQLAPTCQATASNGARVHGGACPPYAEYFIPGDPWIVSESLQSEQGTRFLGKRNRNVLRIADQPLPLKPTHKWLRVEDLLDLLFIDHLVNTDARSVLVCSPWEMLIGREPFTRYRSGFGTDLWRSYFAATCKDLSEIRCSLEQDRQKIALPEILPLEMLQGWEITDLGVFPFVGGPFSVRHINVQARGREVDSWDQPIIDSHAEGRIDLVCGRTKGVLHFLFRARAEAGLQNRVELGPSFLTEPGAGESEPFLPDLSDAVVRADCRQSEEGGRFFRDTNRYRLLDVGESFAVSPGGYWLTLVQIRTLLDEGGWFTNEARCALSMLLPWL